MRADLSLTVKVVRDRHSKDASFVAYNPELDISSCGPTENKARQNLYEAVGITLDYANKKGTLNDLLEESGFEKKGKNWVPPRVSLEPFPVQVLL